MPVQILTHCPETLGFGQIPVPNVPGIGPVRNPAGWTGAGGGSNKVRGVFFMGHGLNTGVGGPTEPPLSNPDSPGGFLAVFSGQWADQLVADGWVVLYCAYPEDTVGLGPAVQTDIQFDTAHGGRYVNTTRLWIDHLIDWGNFYVSGDYRTQVPMVFGGYSWGGWHAMQWAMYRPETLVGAISHIPATLVGNSSITFTRPTNFATTAQVVGGISYPGLPQGCAGIEIGPHDLDHVTFPMMMGYDSLDGAAGFSSTTVAAGNSQDVSTFSGSGVMNVTDTTQLQPGPLLRVATSGGTALIAFTGLGSGTVTGCLTLQGSGVPTTGGGCIQSNTKAIIASQNAAQPSTPITAISPVPTDGHSLSNATVTKFMTWLTTTSGIDAAHLPIY